VAGNGSQSGKFDHGLVTAILRWEKVSRGNIEKKYTKSAASGPLVFIIPLKISWDQIFLSSFSLAWLDHYWSILFSGRGWDKKNP